MDEFLNTSVDETLEKKRNHWLYSSELGRWIMAAAVTGAILLLTFLRVHPVFMTIDDARLMYIYSGSATGVPTGNYLFTYYPIGWVLSKLYIFFPQIPWYALYHYFFIGLGSTLIGKTIYKISFLKEIRFFFAILIHVLLFLSVYLISIIEIHFEITAIMIGTGGISLLLGTSFNKGKHFYSVLEVVLGAVCLAVCFCIQFNSFYSIACFALVVVLYIFLKSISEKEVIFQLKRVLLFVFCTLILVFGCKAADSQAKDSPEWKTYKEYNKYRVSFWDYPHISYAEDPKLFESIGWTENFYELTQSMYFMDSRFNKESLSVFTNRFSWLNLGEAEQFDDVLVESVQSLYQKDKIVWIHTALYSFFFIILLYYLFNPKTWKQSTWPSVISILCCLLGTAVLFAFLALRGRLPLRAWLIFMLPSLTTTCLLYLCAYQNNINISQKRRLLKTTLSFFMVVVLCFSLYYVYGRILATEIKYRRNCNNNIVAMEKYIISHPENVYIYDHYGAQNYYVFSNYTDSTGRPTNGIVWGSSYLYTPTYYQQLTAMGKTQLLTENLFDDDVFLICNPQKEYYELLLATIQEVFPNMSCEQIEQIGGTPLFVYKFTR